MGRAWRSAVAAALLGAVSGQYSTNGSLPVVDLGYEIYQASNFNVRLKSLWTNFD